MLLRVTTQSNKFYKSFFFLLFNFALRCFSCIRYNKIFLVIFILLTFLFFFLILFFFSFQRRHLNGYSFSIHVTRRDKCREICFIFMYAYNVHVKCFLFFSFAFFSHWRELGYKLKRGQNMEIFWMVYE